MAYHSGVEVRQLRCFVAVAEELHFGRAAARLHVAQPAVSQTIRAVEKELGLVLFDRTNRRVALTDAGGVLLDEARGVLDRFDSALNAMARLRSGETGQVRVGAVPALPPSLIPELLSRFAEGAPDVDVVVRALPSGRPAKESLDTSGFDLVLVRGEVHEPGINAAVVAREPVGVALPLDHPLAGRPELTPTDLSGMPLISFDKTTDAAGFEAIFTPLRAAGLTDVRIAHESYAVETSLRLVGSGAGLSLKLASEVAAFASETVVWRPLSGVSLEVVISAAWRPDRTTPALAVLVPLLRTSDDPWRVAPVEPLLEEIETLLAGALPPGQVDRVLATVLFTDLVSSTERLSELGDRAWRDLLQRYRIMVRELLRRFRGREINTRGDDFLATFDGPGRAIRCALALTAAAREMGLQVRTGLHTGEVELLGDDIGGIAVHLGARVAALATDGEVLVSRTVVDLVSGSGIAFEDRGEHVLKGVPGPWQLFAVTIDRNDATRHEAVRE
ncbi:MAG: family 3 adenylate cyclase [Acidimicrobiales bacterium]|nr:family 3 adenylate cyclase [Acidimicrobiales bacterium]